MRFIVFPFHRFLFGLLTASLLGLSTPTLAQKNPLGERQQKRAAQASASSWFPDWSPDSFDVLIAPILGGRARSTEIQGVEVDTLSAEAGLGGKIRGIPLVPGNPGLTVEPYMTYTWGSRSEKQSSESLDETESSGFTRAWYGGLARFYYRPFRYSLDIGRGKVDYDKYFTDVNAQRIVNDFGLMLLPFLSAHYTLTNYTAYEDQISDPSLEETDSWLHARVFFSLFSTQVDIGPGVSEVSTYARDQNTLLWQKLGSGRTSYLKGLASMHIFWRLGASASLKYILDAEQSASQGLLYDQLPDQNLTDTTGINTLPKGSLEASVFVGFRRLLGGFGFGWQYYYLQLKYDNDQESSRIYRDQGFLVTYDVGL